MPNYYKNIYGYFDFENLYSYIANKFSTGRFIEIGTWLGRSTCFMAETLKELNSPVKFYGVDTFYGERDATDQQEIVAKEHGCIYHRFWLNMKEAGVIDYVTPIKMTSQDAAQLFGDESFEFIFLDAEHHYEDVLNDLKNWWPKLKKGGVMAGHDFNGTGVQKAVVEFFNSLNIPIREVGICFLVEKK